jgi:hypothetical protein
LTNWKIPIDLKDAALKVQGHGSKNGNAKSSVTEKRKRFWNPLKMNLEIERVLVLNYQEGGDAACS